MLPAKSASGDPHRSPAPTLLLGLGIILFTVLGYSWYISAQIAGLRDLQTNLLDRSRQESLQLLRIQNDLNLLGIATRDMLDGEQAYPLMAWSAQFERTRLDLEDALARQEALATATRSPEQRRYLTSSLEQFWDAAERVFDLAAAGRDEEARTEVRVLLRAQLAALNTTVSHLLTQNKERETEMAARVQTINVDVQRQVYWFLAATLIAIVGTTVYMVRSNRRLFDRLATLSDERRELTRTLMATRESTLREIARELHDDLGQLLTAMGSMLTRAVRRLPVDAAARGELQEIREIAQSALDNVRGLSQTLHPSILEELGLESAIVWYLQTAERQLGVTTRFERLGTPGTVDDMTAIQVYRVLQEALSNVARHSGTRDATVRLAFAAATLRLDVEDRGKGLEQAERSHGLGLVAMRERAELLGGTLELLLPDSGGTLVRLTVPLASPVPTGESTDGVAS
jgi:signal transduction histidine kinase